MNVHRTCIAWLAGAGLSASLLASAAQPAGAGIGGVLPSKPGSQSVTPRPTRRPPDELRQAPRRNRGAPAGVVAPPAKAASASKARKAP